jgi:hypothetical protein
MKSAVITALFGDYDKWVDPLPELIDPNLDYHLFTDQDISSEVYQVHKTLPHPKIERKIKIMSWNYLRGYDRYIWIDANIHPTKLGLDITTDTDILLLEHPARKCVYEELRACVRLEKDDPLLMTNQIAGYHQEGYPANNGMVQTGFMVRSPTDQNKAFAERWWAEVDNNSRRDQLSFNYSVWRESDIVTFETIPMETFYKHYAITKHKNK